MTGPTVAVFTKNRINPAYHGARLADDRVAARFGGRTVHYVPETPDDPVEQSRLIDQALATRPDAIAPTTVPMKNGVSNEESPNRRTARPSTHSAAGVLSTVIQLAASDEPKNQAFQLTPAACAAAE